MRGASRWLALLTLAGCSGGGETPEAEGGFSVVVRYDSTMPVERLVVAALGPDGAEVWPPAEHDPPLFLDPPGLRQVRLDYPRPAVAELEVLVDGLAGPDGELVGSGHARVVLEDDGPERVVVDLGAPVTCGDGRRAGREACDDGNAEPGDGCSGLCTVEPGWTCTGAPSLCARCGDGELGVGEQCDDGNLVDGDGCSSACTAEAPSQPYLLEVEVLAAQQTESLEWAPVEGTRLSIPAPEEGGHWLVFASGALGSTSDAQVSGQAALRVDGVVVDAFGHQTLGSADNEGGFVSFHVLEAPEPVEVDLAFVAVEGTTTVRDVRIVAMRIPRWAPLASAAALEPREVLGIDQPLLSLGFEVPSPGEYLLLAKGNLSEGPGSDTARIWLVTPEGRVPFDARGVSFSSPRDARVPFFVSRPTALPAGDVRLELRGHSSGAGSLEGWWDERYAYRRLVTVTAGQVDLPDGLPVAITFDHAAMVEAGRARADGRDVRLVVGSGPNARELTRAPDPDRGWGRADTTVWARLPAGVAAADTFADLWLYSGSEPGDDPPEDPSAVFTFFDSFEGAALGGGWRPLQGALLVAGGQLTVPPGSLVYAALDAAQWASPMLLEARLRFVDAPLDGAAIQLGFGAGETASAGAMFMVEQGAHVFGVGPNVQAYMPDPVVRPHVYGIAAVDVANAAFYFDGQPIGQVASPDAGTAAGVFGMQNRTNTDIVYDWVRARAYVAEPPTVSVEPATGSAGLRPSTFDGLRIVALRVDGFGEVFSTVADDAVRTTESATTTLAALEVPAPERAREHLVIMASRVSGDSADARRVGLCLADDRPLMRTAHRIDRSTADPTGYHHVAGVVDARETDAWSIYETAIRSPDGITVEGAASSIAVIRF